MNSDHKQKDRDSSRRLARRRNELVGVALCGDPAGFVRRFHRNENGTISIVTVFAMLMFTVLMVMVVNVGRTVDDKIRMQNAADAAAYSGGAVIARGLNSIAFTNHLLSEVFALVAYMREGQEGHDLYDQTIPDALAMWAMIAPIYQQAGDFADGQTGNAQNISRFAELGRAIPGKLPLEQALVTAFLDMTVEHSAATLPVLEHILQGDGTSADGYIPDFQRMVVRTTPMLAKAVVQEMAQRHGQSQQQQHSNRPMESLLWRTDVQVVGSGPDENDPYSRTLPVVDPSPQSDSAFSTGSPEYNESTMERRYLAERYLRALNHNDSLGDDWIRHWMSPYFSHHSVSPGPSYNNDTERFDLEDLPGRASGKMSQLISLWRVIAYCRLRDLLDEYPTTNLLHVIRHPASTPPNMPLLTVKSAEPLELDYSFVAVTYWPHLDEMFPGLFKNPLKKEGGSDAFAFAQSVVFLPRNRHRKYRGRWATLGRRRNPVTNELEDYWYSHYGNWPGGLFDRNLGFGRRVLDWNLMQQNWTVKLVPAVSQSIPAIVSQRPQVSELSWFRPANLGSVDMQAIKQISTH